MPDDVGTIVNAVINGVQVVFRGGMELAKGGFSILKYLLDSAKQAKVNAADRELKETQLETARMQKEELQNTIENRKRRDALQGQTSYEELLRGNEGSPLPGVEIPVESTLSPSGVEDWYADMKFKEPKKFKDLPEYITTNPDNQERNYQILEFCKKEKIDVPENIKGITSEEALLKKGEDNIRTQLTKNLKSKHTKDGKIDEVALKADFDKQLAELKAIGNEKNLVKRNNGYLAWAKNNGFSLDTKPAISSLEYFSKSKNIPYFIYPDATPWDSKMPINCLNQDLNLFAEFSKSQNMRAQKNYENARDIAAKNEKKFNSLADKAVDPKEKEFYQKEAAKWHDRRHDCDVNLSELKKLDEQGCTRTFEELNKSLENTEIMTDPKNAAKNGFFSISMPKDEAFDKVATTSRIPDGCEAYYEGADGSLLKRQFIKAPEDNDRVYSNYTLYDKDGKQIDSFSDKSYTWEKWQKEGIPYIEKKLHIEGQARVNQTSIQKGISYSRVERGGQELSEAGKEFMKQLKTEKEKTENFQIAATIPAAKPVRDKDGLVYFNAEVSEGVVLKDSDGKMMPARDSVVIAVPKDKKHIKDNGDGTFKLAFAKDEQFKAFNAKGKNIGLISQEKVVSIRKKAPKLKR